MDHHVAKPPTPHETWCSLFNVFLCQVDYCDLKLSTFEPTQDLQQQGRLVQQTLVDQTLSIIK
jgi:hypothetical protein